MMLPKAFVATMEKILGNDSAQFFTTLESEPPISVRYNSKKVNYQSENYITVKWSSGKGKYLKERPIFTLDPIFHGGAYYVQEASSMFIGEIIQQITADSQPLKVLDLCAAPGGKSTLLSATLPEGSLLVCNEVIKNRFQILKENLVKWGTDNCIVTNHDVADFQALEAYFDIILIDAPCSGEGLFRKDKKARQEWSEKNVQLCAARQKRILSVAQSLLKQNGHLIYSTCTYNAQENENNASWFIKSYDYQAVEINLAQDWNIEKRSYGYQFYPHRIKGEGFYAAVFQKKQQEQVSPIKVSKKFTSLEYISKKQKVILEQWIETPEKYEYLYNRFNEVYAVPKSLRDEFVLMDHLLKRKKLGTFIGVFKHDQFIPAHDLATSYLLKTELPKIEVDKPTALLFLKKEKFNASTDQIGWHLVVFEGVNLGWVKVLKNRINNYYPKNWRILMELPKSLL